MVTVSGVVKSVNAEFASGRVNKRAKASGLYLIYLEANSLVNARQVSLCACAALRFRVRFAIIRIVGRRHGVCYIRDNL